MNFKLADAKMAPLTSTFPIEHAHENQHATSKGLEASEIERVVTPDDVQKDVQDYNRIDVSILAAAWATHSA